MSEAWDDQFDRLHDTRPLYHNEDYWRFLIREVWRIDQRPVRVVDFGCGYGWGGLFLLPMLAAGSDYTGIDRSAPLLAQGRALFEGAPYAARLVEGEVTSTGFDEGQFDVAFAHAVLMHLPDPAAALAEMIRVTRDGGLVITCDANHNAINALIHVHETNEQDHTPLSLFQGMNTQIRAQHGADHNIGMKTPVLMRQAGLADVQARVSDAVRLSFPPIETPEQERVFQAICDDGMGGPGDEEGVRRAVAALVKLGVPEAAAEAELRRELANDYRRRGRDYHIVQPGLMTISFGTVRKG